MKTAIHNITVVVTFCLALTALVTLTSGLAHQGGRYQAAAISACQSGAEIPGASYSEVMNGLFSGSGR